MYSHINNHNIHTYNRLLDDKSYKITTCHVWRTTVDMLTVRGRRLDVVNLEAITTYSGSLEVPMVHCSNKNKNWIKPN